MTEYKVPETTGPSGAPPFWTCPTCKALVPAGVYHTCYPTAATAGGGAIVLTGVYHICNIEKPPAGVNRNAQMFCPKCGNRLRLVKIQKVTRWLYEIYACDSCKLSWDFFINSPRKILKIEECSYYTDSKE